MSLSVFLLLLLQVLKQQVEYLFAVIHTRTQVMAVIVRVLQDRSRSSPWTLHS